MLLAFVAASIVKLVINNTRATAKTEPVTEDVVEGAQTIVYYFHGNVRCTTCNTIEANTNKAIKTGFPELMEGGRMKIRTLNMDDPVNEHYVNDYMLTNSSVVVSHLVDGKEVKWARLDEAWDLVSDEALFITHIQKETRAVMEGGDQ